MRDYTRATILKKRRMTRFSDIINAVKKYEPNTVAVAAANDPDVLEAMRQFHAEDMGKGILVGDEEKIREAAMDCGIETDIFEIVHADNAVEAARIATKLVHDGKADILMKGYIHTDDFLRAILDKEIGLRMPGVMMSHVFIAENQAENRLIFVTDSAMNIAPTLEQKATIALNAVYLARHLGYEKPKVGILAAVEVVNPAMPATVEASCLSTMAKRRQFSEPCEIDGPFGLDNAISVIAAKKKHISGNVAGQADVLVMPDIESGNILAKALVWLADIPMAGVLIGTTKPVVVTSRADTPATRFNSLAVATYMADMKRRLMLKIGKVRF
jgi:phosphate butyryltransferase